MQNYYFNLNELPAEYDKTEAAELLTKYSIASVSSHLDAPPRGKHIGNGEFHDRIIQFVKENLTPTVTFVGVDHSPIETNSAHSFTEGSEVVIASDDEGVFTISNEDAAKFLENLDAPSEPSISPKKTKKAPKPQTDDRPNTTEGGE